MPSGIILPPSPIGIDPAKPVSLRRGGHGQAWRPSQCVQSLVPAVMADDLVEQD